MMRLPSFSKLFTVSVLILALIAVFTYNVVDYDTYLRRLTGAPPPANSTPDNGGDDTPPVPEVVPLRIMFMGASITRGEVSTGDRGYRKHIRDAVTSWGRDVNCVGFNRFGDWGDNDVEGWGSFRIRTITRHARQSVPALRPNLVIVQVGTSDCFQKDDTANMGARMRVLAEAILAAEPRATVILSTLATTPDADVEPCILDGNAQIRQAAADLAREDRPVALAEMHYGQGLPGRPTPEDIGPDRIHPTDAGYAMMGDILLESIREVEAKGFLQRAANNSIPDSGDDSDSRGVEDAIKEETERDHPVAPPRRRRALL